MLPSNDPPVATDDAAATTAGSAVAVPVLANDSDPDGDPLSVTGSSAPANGSVTCAAASCTYTPAAAFTGVDTFTYTVSDGFGGTTTALVTITVGADPNSPPQPADDAASTPSGSPLSIAPLANDSDPDGDPLAITAWTAPSSGTVSCTASGCIYTPNTGFVGTDSFSYTVDDGRGGTASATVVVSVTPASAPPPAAGARADLAVEVVGPVRYRPGANDDYTVTVTNGGPDPAAGAVVTLTIPSELHVAGWITIEGGGECTVALPLITCSLGTIEVGGTRQITLVGARGTGGAFAVGASAVSNVSDPQTSNNAASWQVEGRQALRVKPPTDTPPPPTRLLLTKRATPTVVGQGGQVRYVLLLRNVGDAPAENIVLCDRPSRHAVFVSAPGAVFRNGRACWTIRSLAASGRVTVTVTVRIDSAAPAGALVAPAVARAGNVQEAAHASVQLRVRIVHTQARPGGVTG